MHKNDVIKITLELIKEKKLEKTSIGEIVKKLSSSPGNLYYHFNGKSEIYKAAADYAVSEIINKLSEVKLSNNKKNDLFELTRTFIRFLEEKEEIFFFLIYIRGSYYLEEEIKAENFLRSFIDILIIEMKNIEKVNLKLNIFLGSVYEILYANNLFDNRKVKENEIVEICETFWRN